MGVKGIANLRGKLILHLSVTILTDVLSLLSTRPGLHPVLLVLLLHDLTRENIGWLPESGLLLLLVVLLVLSLLEVGSRLNINIINMLLSNFLNVRSIIGPLEVDLVPFLTIDVSPGEFIVVLLLRAGKSLLWGVVSIGVIVAPPRVLKANLGDFLLATRPFLLHLLSG